MIGATGDLMMEMTGEISDGCVLNYCVPPEYNDKAMELLDKGAKKAGRRKEGRTPRRGSRPPTARGVLGRQ